ncbi:MAG TPA: alanine--tRNA ligase [Gemmatimonadaceae bacterium]|nr:alanine--tRNA ligase [Gemmatimonadaceae bacterium]
MQAAEIRQRFLDYFARHGHSVQPSGPLVPKDDPTLLFANAGMVQYKKVFLGQENPAFGRRAATSQKCVRAGGKHNDLEQVGHTARHHTFFEMLGNFSFGDYFKRDAIRFAWEFLTKDLKLDARHLRVSVFHEDEEARALWREIAGLPDSRIYGLGAHDNFWQMADTGPCGPCSEIFTDLAHVTDDYRFPAGATGEWTERDRTEFSKDAFVEGTEAGRFLEFWNLVFMQFDKQPDGTLVPLPKPSVDTGLGLDRTSAIVQRVDNNYHTDLFRPLIESVENATGIPYRGKDSDEPFWHQFTSGPHRADYSAAVQKDNRVLVDPASFRVIADHGRAVAFLLADAVFPSNEGRGYVLRRILRRGVRHGWLLGRSTPMLAQIVERVIELMGDVYPELRQRRKHIIDTTLAEEQRFLATIDGGMRRFDEIAPPETTQGSDIIRGTVSGEDAFRLYDTFGFPIDLTELMARERGYTVDIAGFEQALAAQRTQSQEERRSRQIGVSADDLMSATWHADGGSESSAGGDGESRRAGAARNAGAVAFVGYDRIETDTTVIDYAKLADGRVAVMLKETPFYAESGGQVSDTGTITGEGWRLDVEEVRKVDGQAAVVGEAEGEIKLGHAHAAVPRDKRLDTERNHTATHLLHAALRDVLGEHVHQAGSLVAPDRLRFDFTHHGPMSEGEIARVEEIVNREVFNAIPLDIAQKSYSEALSSGAMALFGEKYGDVVRVVRIPGVSAELCGGTHVRNTSEIGLFRVVAESGVAAGVRRIEAITGPKAYARLNETARALDEVADVLRTTPENVVRRVQSLVEEKRSLEKRVDEAMRSGNGGEVERLVERAQDVKGIRVVVERVAAPDTRTFGALADAIRDRLGSGVAVLAAEINGKQSLLCVVTDDLRERGMRADSILKQIAEAAGGRGGGKAHMAQGGVPDESAVAHALAAVMPTVEKQLASL